MKSSIIYVHPWEASFNNYLLETTKASLFEKGNEINLIDLYKEKKHDKIPQS